MTAAAAATSRITIAALTPATAAEDQPEPEATQSY